MRWTSRRPARPAVSSAVPENFAAFVTSSDTSGSAVDGVRPYLPGTKHYPGLAPGPERRAGECVQFQEADTLAWNPRLRAVAHYRCLARWGDRCTGVSDPHGRGVVNEVTWPGRCADGSATAPRASASTW